jgi:hypothetical protein
MGRWTLGFLVVVGIVGCAHHKDVRPGAEGIHRVVIENEGTGEFARDALKQAQHYCKEQGQSAAVVSEEQKYVGDMDEKTYRNAKRVTSVAKTVGGAVWAMGAPRESNAGGVIGLGGAAGDSALGNAYQFQMSFKCK